MFKDFWLCLRSLSCTVSSGRLAGRISQLLSKSKKTFPYKKVVYRANPRATYGPLIPKSLEVKGGVHELRTLRHDCPSDFSRNLSVCLPMDILTSKQNSTHRELTGDTCISLKTLSLCFRLWAQHVSSFPLKGLHSYIGTIIP